MGYEAALAAYTAFDFTHGGRTYPVYRRGSGPAVIIMHEMPGLHPLVIRFADNREFMRILEVLGINTSEV